MTATVERIKKDIRSLAPDEVDHLLRDLQNEYTMPSAEETDEAGIEAEWDEEIDRRVAEVENGTVVLLTAEESERRVDALFAKHGIQRRHA